MLTMAGKLQQNEVAIPHYFRNPSGTKSINLTGDFLWQWRRYLLILRKLGCSRFLGHYPIQAIAYVGQLLSKWNAMRMGAL